MFCYKCGKQLPDDAMFCSACGTTVRGDALLQPEKEAVKSVPPTEPTVEPMQSKPEKAKKPKKEKKPVNPGKKKTVLMILGALALLAAVVVGICLYLQNHDVADIPDPQYYFSALADTDVDDYGSSMSIEIESETDVLKEAVQAYYELLTSAYPFELKREETGTDGKFAYLLTYNGDGSIWNRSSICEIDIEYDGRDDSDGHYEAGIWISRPKNFNIAKREQYDGSVSSENAEGGADDFSIVSIPDLAHYFSAQNQSEEETEARFTFDTDPRDAVRYYVELLQNKYSVVLAEVYEDDGAGEWVLHHKDDPDAPFTIWVDRTGDGTWEVICRLHIFVIQMDWEVWEWPNAEVPAPEPTPEPEPEPQPMQQPTQQQPVSKPSSSDPSVIPNFLDHDASGKYAMSDSSSSDKGIYEAFDLSADYVVQNYVDLLKDMGYSVVYKEEDVHSGSLGGVFKQWDLRHDGVDADALRKESSGQIRVKLNTYESWNKCSVSVEFADGITMENYGAGGSGSFDSNDFWDTCSACNGSKKCTHCNGTDTRKKFQAGIGWVQQDCTFCSGGRCPTCGGTGKP